MQPELVFDLRSDIPYPVYGWRSAGKSMQLGKLTTATHYIAFHLSIEVENLAKMQRRRHRHIQLSTRYFLMPSPEFAGTQQIFLGENYRSTGAILRASLEIISRGTPVPILGSEPLMSDSFS